VKSAITIITKFFLVCLMSGLLTLGPAMADQGNISPTDKYAWSESMGWVNFRPAHGGVTVHDTYLSGYAWAGNFGWIKLGNDNAGPYQNTTADNWGVNTDADGNLSGYGWSEAWGWISFKTSHGQVTTDADGRFDGYAWSQNMGWIHFGNPSPAYNVRKINIAPTLTASEPEMAGLTDDDTDNSGTPVSEILADFVTDVGNGALEGMAIYSADSGNGEWQYSTDHGDTYESMGSVSQTDAILLGADDSIRFVPDGSGADEASFSFHAWDQTSGTPGEKADVSVRGDTTAFSSTGDTASVTVLLIIDVSGQVTYYSSEEPLANVLVTLESEDGSSHSAYTDEKGYFAFSDIPPGDYTLRPSKDDDLGKNSVSAEDASLIARHAVGIQEFSDHQKLAADVNENDRITVLDASDVSRYSVGLLTAMNDRENQWAFAPDSVSYSLDSDRENQKFSAVRLGDVSGSYSPGQLRRTPKTSSSEKTAPILKAAPGDRLSLPVVLNGGAEIGGIDIRIGYDSEMLEVADVTLTDGILEYEDYHLITNTAGLSLALFAASEPLFTGDGTILFIDFDVVGTKQHSVIEFTMFQCNESPVSDGHEAYRKPGTLSGGFYVSDTVSQRIILGTGTEYLPKDEPVSRYDLNGDGRVGLEDAIHALRQEDLEGTIRALQCVTGK